MKFKTLVLGVSCMLAAGAAAAQTETEKALEARVAALEAALKAALEALKPPAPAPAATPAPATAAAGKPGTPVDTPAKPAAATASGVEVFADLNVAVLRTDVGGAVSTGVVNMNIPSRIGFKGQRNLALGPIEAAYGLIEWQLDTPEGTPTAGLASREGWGGLKTSLGDIAFGRGKSVYTKALESAGAAGFAVSTAFDFSYGNTGYSTGGLNMNRWANDIRYQNNFGPVALRLDYALDEKGNSGQGGKKYGGSAIYRWGGKGRLTAAFMKMYDVSTVSPTATVNTPVCIKPTSASSCITTNIVTPNPLAGLNTPGNNNRAWVIGVDERFFGLEVSLGYQSFNRKTGTNGVKSTDQWSLIGGLSYPLSERQTLSFAFDKKSNTKVDGVASTVSAANITYGLAYNYALDKKTNLRVEYTNLRYDSGQAGPVKLGSGVMYEF